MKTIISVLFALVMLSGLGFTIDRARAENPCGANPCATNPCTSNPCSVNPCSVKNVCSSDPAAENTPIRRYVMTDMEKVKAYGEELWTDASLGTSGVSCSVCHPNGKDLRVGPWPKFIKMAGDIITLDQMINFCMMNPMKAKPLSWNHQKMTALAHYVSTHSNDPEGGKAVDPCAMNPCARNPCAANPCAANPCATNPCGANPCGAIPCGDNPCGVNTGGANPCGVNPCGANPCGANPCGANPCGANPCGANPCGANPCGVNPCGVTVSLGN